MGSALAPALLAPNTPVSDILTLLTRARSCENCCSSNLCIIVSLSANQRPTLDLVSQSHDVIAVLSLPLYWCRINTELCAILSVSASSLSPGPKGLQQTPTSQSELVTVAREANKSAPICVSVRSQGKANFPLCAHGLPLLFNTPND